MDRRTFVQFAAGAGFSFRLLAHACPDIGINKCILKQMRDCSGCGPIRTLREPFARSVRI